MQREVCETDSSLQSEIWSHEGLTIVHTDALGRQTRRKLNGAGEIAHVIDDDGNETDYEYDAFGNLLKTRDPLGNEIVLSYNVRGMKMTSSDPDMGNWIYDYFPLGELKKQTDAKGQIVEFTYDKLSRLTKREEDEGDTYFNYGDSAAADNIGHLTSVTSPGGYSETHTFDTLSRPSQSTIGIDGSSYQINRGYSSTLGFLETLTYPTSTGGVRFKVKYAYQNGHLHKVNDFTGDVLGTTFWEAVSTNARGQIIDERFGANLQSVSDYDFIAGWLRTRQTDVGGSPTVQNLQYAWNKVGNLTSRQDLNQSLTESFGYDDLHRLTTVTGPVNLTIAYNAIGNIESRTDIPGGNWTYHTTKKHAVTSAGGVSYGYDANGNMNSRAGAGITWSSYNLPTLINQSGGNSSSFTYGADRQRTKQVNQSLASSSARRCAWESGGAIRQPGWLHRRRYRGHQWTGCLAFVCAPLSRGDWLHDDTRAGLY